jgi:hypothetical protein
MIKQATLRQTELIILSIMWGHTRITPTIKITSNHLQIQHASIFILFFLSFLSQVHLSLSVLLHATCHLSFVLMSCHFFMLNSTLMPFFVLFLLFISIDDVLDVGGKLQFNSDPN